MTSPAYSTCIRYFKRFPIWVGPLNLLRGLDPCLDQLIIGLRREPAEGPIRRFSIQIYPHSPPNYNIYLSHGRPPLPCLVAISLMDIEIMSSSYYSPSNDPSAPIAYPPLTKEEEEIFNLLVDQTKFVQLHANASGMFIIFFNSQRLLTWVFQLRTI